MRILTLIRQAARHLRRHPVTTFAFVGLAGVALGAFLAATSSLRAVQQLAHRFADPDTLVYVTRLGTSDPAGSPISGLEYADWRARSTVFSEIAAIHLNPAPRPFDTVAPDGTVARFRPLPVTTTFFTVLGVSPIEGRLFVDSDAQAGAAPVAVLSRRAAQALFGSSEAALGQSIRMADVWQSPPATVVGVVADEVRLRLIADYDVYVPEVIDTTIAQTARFSITYGVIGRLRPGVGVRESEVQMSALVRQLFEEHPLMPGTGAIVSPLHTREYGDVIDIYQSLVLASVVGIAIVLITLASLCVSTAAVRRAEFAVRRACGATRPQLHAQLVVETAILTTAAAAVAVVVSTVVTSWLYMSLPVDLSLAAWAQSDRPSLAIALAGLVLIAGVWWGIISLMVIGPDARAASRLRRERWRWLDWTVGVHAALVLACLVPALTIVSGHRALLNIPLGFDPRGVTVAEVLVHPLRMDLDAFNTFTTTLLEELGRHPDIHRVAVASGAPFEDITLRVDVTDADNDARAHVVLRSVSPSYFSTMSIPLEAGRAHSGNASPCEVVVSDGFATFGGIQPHIGSELNVGRTRCRVVGIAPGVREWRLRDPLPVVYRAFSADWLPPSLWVMATARHGHAVPSDAIRQAVTAVNSYLTVEQVPLTSLVDRATATSRFYAAVLAVASAGAFGLVIASVFSLLSHAVRSRRRELAIRAALGGRWAHVGWTVARRVTIGLVFGTAAGLAASHALLRIAAHLSTVPAASGSWLSVLAIGLLWLAALLAAAVPVVSAVRTHPSEALRDVPS